MDQTRETLMEELEDETNSVRFAAYAMVGDGWLTANELAEKTNMAYGTARTAINRLDEMDLLLKRAQNTRGAGRSPTAYNIDYAVDDGDESDTEERRTEVIVALARIHYVEDMSTAKTSQVAQLTSYTTSQLSHTLVDMLQEGVVEVANPGGATNRYRLVPPEEWSPFYGEA